ncbi:MAG: indole-3-glycerol phosphate synthase TrpC [Eubacterium sp.]|nr:indole-3-glycerol phosphate synthase TrpC [Eubacterium sp.]
MTILDEIAGRTRERIAKCRQQLPLHELRMQAEAMPKDTRFPFECSLKSPGISLICEVKRASPSRGVIAQEFPYVQIAKEYEEAGAAAVSCLTEPFYFQGRNEDLREICDGVSIPVLRKDFTIDAYMIYEAKVLGASAVLLICAILSDQELKEYLAICDRLGLSALVEAHTDNEVERALECGGRVIGVNNRDLHTFEVDLATSIRLRKMVPQDLIYVSESGIRSTDDIELLYHHGTEAVLIGEALMRAADKRDMILRLKESCC